MNILINTIEQIVIKVRDIVAGIGRFSLFLLSFLRWLFTPPFRFSLLVKQLEFVGNKSALVIFTAASFTGAVLGLQLGLIFRLFNAESLIGATTAKSLALELAPIITGFIVTGRAAAAMTAEIGTMRVSEQLDAMEAMGVNTVSYLVVPRVLASIFMMPLLTSIFLFIGIIGCYGLVLMIYGVDEATFFQQIQWIVEWKDIIKGLVKAIFFGFVLSSIACYKGFQARSGARGVGQATTDSVVSGLLAIILTDFIITYIQVK